MVGIPGLYRPFGQGRFMWHSADDEQRATFGRCGLYKPFRKGGFMLHTALTTKGRNSLELYMLPNQGRFAERGTNNKREKLACTLQAA